MDQGWNAHLWSVQLGSYVRPKMMTVTAIIAGLLPIMWSTGVRVDVMNGAMPEVRPCAGADASESQTGSAEPAGHAVRSSSGMQKRRLRWDFQKITWLG